MRRHVVVNDLEGTVVDFILPEAGDQDQRIRFVTQFEDYEHDPLLMEELQDILAPDRD